MTTVIITEKPSVARDIANVLRLTQQNKGSIEGPGYIVTWAFGHLVGLAEPHQINPAWKAWRIHDLPMLPDQWPLEIMEATAGQFLIIQKLINAVSTKRLICATDAGREGELIFRYIYEKAQCRKAVERLWISSLTPEAIQKGLTQLRPLHEFDGLADSARARSRADWLVGMNLSRAYSLKSGEHFSIGRVQTPTLAMLVEREKSIQNFVVEDYVILQGEFQQADSLSYSADYFQNTESSSAALQARRFAADDPELKPCVERLKKTVFSIAHLKEKSNRIPAPQLYDLTELQRHANRIFGFSAQRTLDLAQDLYEKFKLITYPRTDSRYIGEDIHSRLPEIVANIISPYQSLLPPSFATKSLNKRFVDASKVSDHHAILPTGQKAGRLGPDHEQLYDMICRRLLTAYLDDFVSLQTEAVLQEHAKATEGFFARGRKLMQQGWKILDLGRQNSQEKDLPPSLAVGKIQNLKSLTQDLRKTVPPARLNDASLLTAMETAGNTLDDKELSAVMREHGLGTPATRSGMIETLIKRQYIERDKKSFRATEKGMQLIAMVSDPIKSPGLTGQWELKLSQLRKGLGNLDQFTAEIMDFVREMTQVCLNKKIEAYSRPTETRQGASAYPQLAITETASLPAAVAKGPATPESLLRLLKERFGFSQFRPHQESTCLDLARQKDVLLVMPTGAGKSLCYQLPGLALGGPTLVISPLIALMDDQVMRLKSMGMGAEAIHSGKTRALSQEICQSYAAGKLDFLFIAPERLGVPGFVDFLSRFKPSLIAVDEAHCISQWGHDFRYDYRRVAERLAPLQPTTIIAMTATATSRVQKDIIDNLHLKSPALHVHGFRRINIAIENIELSKKDRAMAAIGLLQSKQALPAIVYAPTRKDAEALALLISRSFRAAAYHAGMDPKRRNQVQTDFLEDKLEVIVATIAFGMGIDKSNVRTVMHMAVPSSIEGYYQEIGRAGRDGLPARALLFYSYADVKTHEYFHKLNYPEVKELRSVYQLIPATGLARADLSSQAHFENLDNLVERLLMIDALEEDSSGVLRLTKKKLWEKAYEEQKQHRHKQLMETIRYVNETNHCRMLGLMSHFGDPDAQGNPCGLCDICSPQNSQSKVERTWTPEEIAIAKRLLTFLGHEGKAVATGKLFREYGQALELSRRDYDNMIQVLIDEKYLLAQAASFVKDGETIDYKTVALIKKIEEIDWHQLKRTTTRLTESPSKKTRSTRSRQGASRSPTAAAQPDLDSCLLESLKIWRKSESSKRRLPAFRILSDKSLEAIASQKPRDRQGLLQVHGIGDAKLDLYGDSLLGLIEQF